MLEALVLILRPAVAAMTVVTAAGFLFPHVRRRQFASAFLAAIAGSGLLAVSVEQGTASRETADGFSMIVATAGLLSLLFASKLVGAREGSRWRWFVAAGAFLALIPWLTALVLQLLRATESAEPLQGFPWARVAGMMGGFLIAGLLGAGVRRFRTSREETAGWEVTAMRERRADLVTRSGLVLLLGALLVEQLLVLLQIALAYGYLPLTPTTVEIAAPVLNARGWLFYLVPAGWIIVTLPSLLRGVVRGPGSRVLPAFANAAERRLHCALGRRSRALGLSVVACATLAAALVGWQGLLDQRGTVASLSPAEMVTASQGVITLSTADLVEGELARYAYPAGDGTEVRFLAVNKGSGIYSVALDACSICGPTGYSQVEGDVLCRACDVLINVPTIGFRGGCNPIPLEAELTSGELRLRASDLESQTRKFW
ncbi:MAG: Fe-S-containing protein [Thermoleophilia bacterium]